MHGALDTGRRGRIALLGLILALGAGLRSAPAATPEPPPWRVLILYDVPFDNPAAVAVVEALRSSLCDGAAPQLVDLHSEGQDTLNEEDLPYLEPELLARLRRAQYTRHLDLVIAMGSSVSFARRHREELWPGVPIVGFGGPEKELREGASRANATGVAMAVDEAGTLRLARRLQPDAERLVLVAGASHFDRSSWPRLEAAAAREGAGLEVETLFGRPLRAILDRLSSLPPRSIVLYTTFSQGPKEQTRTPADIAEQLSRASVAPVYGVWESQLGRGIVGGSMESLADHGRRAAAIALRVLRGTPPDDIPFALPSAHVPVVDWRQLERFGLSAAALPPGSEIRYRPPSFVEEHLGAVVAGGLVLAVQTGLIVALLVQGRRRQRAEAEATRQRAELAHAARLAVVGELAASIAHEINQPLGAILGNAEAAELFLDSDPPKLDRLRRILQDIQKEDRRASDVIHEVRRLAQKQRPEPLPLSLNAVVADVLPLLEADARRRGARIEIDYGAGLPVVHGVPTQLRQVVLNLALNGLEAAEASGPGERRVRIRTRAADGTVELTVSDTGPGLAEEDLSRVFESFFTTKTDGLGLGLSIVRSIVEAHEGRVVAENNGGPGATFRILLPAAPGDARPPSVA
jgi:signal transduction histidine kinase